MILCAMALDRTIGLLWRQTVFVIHKRTGYENRSLPV